MPTLNLQQATIDDLRAALGAQSVPPPATGATPPAIDSPPLFVPTFIAPPQFASRARMTSAIAWQSGLPSFYSAGALTDTNIWLIGFTVTSDVEASLSAVEYQGARTMRSWWLMLNRNASIVAKSASPVQAPTLQFNGSSSPIAPRIPLVVGERYTVAIVNAQAGVSSRMVGQLYFK